MHRSVQIVSHAACDLFSDELQQANLHSSARQFLLNALIWIFKRMDI